jgi:hypothetical protein
MSANRTDSGLVYRGDVESVTEVTQRNFSHISEAYVAKLIVLTLAHFQNPQTPIFLSLLEEAAKFSPLPAQE